MINNFEITLLFALRFHYVFLIGIEEIVKTLLNCC
jgi:hypothetical protein